MEKNEGRNEWETCEIRISKQEREQDQLLSRRKFLKISIGAGVGLAAGSIGIFGYGIEKINKNLDEVENEYPKPAKYEYEIAVNEVDRHNQKKNLYNLCQDIADKPKACEIFRSKNTTEVQGAQSILLKQNTYEKERDKRIWPWVALSAFSASIPLGGIARAIISSIQLRRVNMEIKKLKKTIH